MSLNNCPWCGRLFVETTHKVCPNCLKEEEADFEQIVAFLREQGKATVDEVHEATEVDRRRIIKFIRQGRFVSSDFSFKLYGKCEKCEDPILEGRYCDKCASSLVDELKGTHKPRQKAELPQKRKKERMHIADRIKKHKK